MQQGSAQSHKSIIYFIVIINAEIQKIVVWDGLPREKYVHDKIFTTLILWIITQTFST